MLRKELRVRLETDGSICRCLWDATTSLPPGLGGTDPNVGIRFALISVRHHSAASQRTGGNRSKSFFSDCPVRL